MKRPVVFGQIWYSSDMCQDMRFWGSHSSECQDYGLLGCEFVSAKWRNLLTCCVHPVDTECMFHPVDTECMFHPVDTECMFLLIVVSLLSNCMESCPRRPDSWCANSALQVKLAAIVFDVCTWHLLSFQCMVQASICDNVNHCSKCYGIFWDLSLLHILFPWPRPCVWLLMSCYHHSAVVHMSPSVVETTGRHHRVMITLNTVVLSVVWVWIFLYQRLLLLLLLLYH